MALAPRITGILLSICILLQPLLIGASPVQYCRSTTYYNFCLALESFKNSTSGQTDAFMTFMTTRETDAATGWNAVGFGDQMNGALMFVMYGDPKSKTGPTVSVRSTMGHKMPSAIEVGKGFPQVQVASTEYITAKDSPQQTLSAHIICYSCDKWTGRESSQPYQPFIWAVNTAQEFDGDFSPAANLDMHSHDSGFGVFYANIAQSLASDTSVASVPAINNKVLNTGTQDTAPAGLKKPSNATPRRSFRSWMWAVHGIFMTMSFFLLHPLGIVAMRAGIPQAFKYHWVIQLAASICSGTGMLIGILLSRAFVRWHQYIGIILLLAVIAQATLGWRHHMIYVRSKQRTWISTAHVWLGRFILLAGWFNLVLGMLLKHWSYYWIMATMGFIMVEGGAVFFSTALASYARKYRSLDAVFTHKSSNRQDNGQDWEEYLALSDQSADEDDGSDIDHENTNNKKRSNDDDDDHVYSQEARGGLPATGLMSGIPANGLEEDPHDDIRTWLPASSK